MIEKIKLYVKGITQEAADTTTIHFARQDQQFDYLPGQRLNFGQKGRTFHLDYNNSGFGYISLLRIPHLSISKTVKK